MRTQTRLTITSFLACILALFCKAHAADWPSGFPSPAGSGDLNATYVTLSLSSTLTNERVLSPSARFTVTDNGANGTYVLELATVPVAYGGSGATTAQGAINTFADGAAGAAAASGDILYRGATNWTRLAKGADGEFLSLSGGLPIWTTSPAGAPASSSYLTLGLDGGLSAERVLTAGSGVGFTDGGANSTLTVAVDSTVIRTTGAQSLAGPKTLSGGPIIAAAQTDGLVLAGSTFNDTILITDPAANRTLTIPDPGGAASFVMTEGAQTVNGVKTFGSAPKLSTNTLTSSTGNTITFPNASDTVVMLTQTQTLTNKELTAPSITSNSLTLKQTTANYTLDWANPGAARNYHIRDAGGDADVAMMGNAEAHANGAVIYSNGSVQKVGPVGSSGQPLLSGGAGAYTWGTLSAAFGGTGTTTVPAKGSVLVGNAGGTAYANLTVGTDGQVLQADSASTNGVKWATAGTGTVTDFSAGDLSPIFTTSEATTTTTPALTFSLSTCADKTFLGNHSGGVGAPSYIQPAFTDISGTAAATQGGTGQSTWTTGDLLYASASNTLSKLGIGTSNQVLTVSGGVPTWATPAASGGGFTISTKTASFTASDGASYYYRMTTNDMTVTLPASPADGSVRKFKMVTAAKTATFAFNGAETINHADGSSDQSLTLTSEDGVLELTAVSGGWDET